MSTINTISAELVVIGGGLAGLRAAAAAAEEGTEVLLLTSGPSASPDLSGFSAAVDARDSLELYVADIEASAQGINNTRLARKLAEMSLAEIDYLEGLGFVFDKNEDGTYNTIQSLGCSVPRLVHYQSKTGVMAMELTRKSAVDHKARIISSASVLSLINHEGKIAGVLYYDHNSKELCCCKCKAIVLATGGYGAIQKFSTYPVNIFGSGYAMAFQAGADMVDMELQQFEPCLYVYPPEIKGKVLVTTLIRNGAKLYNGEMHEFMSDYGLTADNAQKGPLSRAIYSEIMAGRSTPHGGIYYDVRELPDKLLFVDSRIFTQPAVNAGLDLHKDLPEVAPGGHTSLGGVKVDENCQSSIENLFACGEVIGGVHGANRLGGNAGAETLAFGRVAGQSAAKYIKNAAFPGDEEFETVLDKAEASACALFTKREGSEKLEDICLAILDNMSDNAGIIRSEESLLKAQENFALIEKRLENAAIESDEDALLLSKCKCMMSVGKMAVAASLLRKESRGVYYRSDYPERNDAEWLKNIVIHNNEGNMSLEVCECIKN